MPYSVDVPRCCVGYFFCWRSWVIVVIIVPACYVFEIALGCLSFDKNEPGVDGFVISAVIVFCTLLGRSIRSRCEVCSCCGLRWRCCGWYYCILLPSVCTTFLCVVLCDGAGHRCNRVYAVSRFVDWVRHVIDQMVCSQSRQCTIWAVQ